MSSKTVILIGLSLVMTFAGHAQNLEPVAINLGKSSYTLATRTYSPSTQPKQKTVLITHDAFNHQDSYQELAIHLSSKGFRVITFDLLGWGRSTPLKKSETGVSGFQRGLMNHSDQARTQIQSMIDHAKAQAPDNKIYLLCEGLSSLLVHDFLNTKRDIINGAVFIRPLKSKLDIKKQSGFKNYTSDQFVIPKLPSKTRQFFQSMGEELNKTEPTTEFIQTKRYYAFKQQDQERDNHDYLNFLYYHYYNAQADFTNIQLENGESTLDAQSLRNIIEFLSAN